MTNDDLHDLAAAYALDALDSGERQEFEQHLLGCDRCQQELAALRETVGTLAQAAEGPVPPAELRGRIILAARQEGAPNVIALRPRRSRLYAAGALAAAATALAIGLYVALPGGTSKHLALSAHGGVATVSGFEKAPAGKVWELWVIRDSVPHRAGLFAGGGKAIVHMTYPATPGTTVAVTLERAGGVSAPTGKIFTPTPV